MLAALVPIALVLLSPSEVFPEPPPNPVGSFETAKTKARDEVYYDRRVTFYCQCFFETTGNSGGRIDAADCAFAPRNDSSRARRLEWEHIVPASRLARHRPCWTTGHPDCTEPGRPCCEKAGVDPSARTRITDLHNLVPAVGQVNGDRSNHPYGEVVDEPRVYGECDFELDGQPKVAEPRNAIRGNVARVYLYMNETYLQPEGVGLSAGEIAQLNAWSESDPPGDWERERDARIKLLQGNSNRFVTEAE